MCSESIPVFAAKKKVAVAEDVLSLAYFLIFLQVVDALLTTVGLEIHGGIKGEGNEMLRYGMNMIGILPTLLISKSVAVAFIFGLCRLSSKVSWVNTAFRGLVGVYLSAAIIPWSIIILSNLP